MWAQVCFWYLYPPFNYSTFEETCGPERIIRFTDEGVYYAALGRPSGWWNLNSAVTPNGMLDWNLRPHDTRIMLKDPETGTLFQDVFCGDFCWSRGTAADHQPVTMKAELIFVEAGKTFVPPSDWVGHPF